MKAITFHRYGPPEILELSEIEKPTLGDYDVLIRVKAASVNPLDWHIMRGKPLLARLTTGLLKPQNPLLGADVAGVVEAIGPKVSMFKAGDKVFGTQMDVKALGSLAEYVCCPEKNLLTIPTDCSFEEAGAIPVAALTAIQSLQDGQLRAGQRVLINGASGGVGSCTVQMAKAIGAEVVAVCSTRNIDLVRSLGADQVVDYTQTSFPDIGKSQKFDLLIDNVGNYSLSVYREALKSNGVCVIVGYTSAGLLMQHTIMGSVSSMFSKKRAGMMKTASMIPEDFSRIKKLLESGQLKAVIDRTYPLSRTADAISYLETGHARGKVVITIDSNQ